MCLGFLKSASIDLAAVYTNIYAFDNCCNYSIRIRQSLPGRDSLPSAVMPFYNFMIFDEYDLLPFRKFIT